MQVYFAPKPNGNACYAGYSSNKLSFRLFADDANIFYTSDDINGIESVMNCEMTRVLNYCAINKLSVNMKKTNFMLITS